MVIRKIFQYSCVFFLFLVLSLNGLTRAEAEDSPKYGGILKFGNMMVTSTWGDPLKLRHLDTVYSQMVLEWLVLPSPKSGQLQPNLATSWELVPDKSYYDIHLRKGVKFHDGTDFNAQAVKWNLDRALKSKRQEFEKVTSIDVIDDYTVRLNLSVWDNRILNDLWHDAALIISPTAFEKNGADWAATHPVGTGPYQFKDYKAKQYIKVEKFDGYWDKDLPYLDGIECIQIPDPMTFMAAMKRGDINGTFGMNLVTVMQLEKTGKYNILVRNGIPLSKALTFNSTSPDSPWSDKRMRQALEYAIDKEKIVNSLSQGYYKPIYDLILGIREAGGHPNVVPRRYNPEKAKELMAEAGYPNGLKVELRSSIYQKREHGNYLLAVQEDLSKVGIDLKLTYLDDATAAQESFRPPEGSVLRFETIRGDLFSPAEGVLQSLSEKTIYLPGLKRPAGFQSLFEQSLLEENPEKSMELLVKMEEMAAEDAMYIPLYMAPMFSIFDKSVHNIAITHRETPNTQMGAAWLSK